MVENKIDDKILKLFLPDILLCAAGTGLVTLAGIIIVGCAGMGCTGISDHGATAEAAKGFSGQEKICNVLLNVAGSFFFHALGLLPI